MMDSETWSYTILGNSTASEIYGTFLDIIIASLSPKECDNLDRILNNSEILKTYIEKCYDTLVSYAFKTKSRLGFQALGVFLMKYGAKMTDKLKTLILKYSKWKDEYKELKNEEDRNERKKYVFDFREKVIKYKPNEKVKIPNESVSDVISKKELAKNNSLIWRQSINHKIEDLEVDLKEYFKINKTIFKLNDVLALKLEGGKTFIYVKGKKFIICKHIFIDIPIEKAENIYKNKSVDEYIDSYHDSSYHIQNDSTYIPINTEFWVHCSNMQVWVESNYDSSLLHSNLSFPLLKKLTDVGDPKAKRVFKEEIVKRFESGYIPVMEFLLNRGYIKYLDNNELQFLINSLNELIENKKNISKCKALLKIKKEMNNYSLNLSL